MPYIVMNLVVDTSVRSTNRKMVRSNEMNFAYVAAWEYVGKPSEAVLHKEPLVYENVKLVTRSYK
jgi:succinate dehydrogenase / fumarate reductase flavoprotein subunit